ncbi:MAG: phage terminase large subunit family protein [Verrucomicrobiales bacterium]|jgi:phage terminase large subunit GpA-like protein|nr:phage terminase large subunit family protein [Verrucomicrobiales bacterium]
MTAPVFEALRHGLRVPPKLTPRAFAERHVYIPHSDQSKRFNGALAPWLNEPMAAVADNAQREITVCAPTGSGKTTMFEVLLPYIIAQDSGGTLIIFQSDPDAAEWAETRLWPILRHCAPVTPFFPASRHAKRKAQIIFPHMPLFIAGANPSSLQSKSMRWCIGDEVWLWRPGMLEEFRKRTHDRWNARVLLVGQAGLEGDDFHAATRLGEPLEWCWECPHCQHVQPYKFGDLKWGADAGAPQDGGAAGDAAPAADGAAASADVEPDWAALAASVRLECPSCGAAFADTPEQRRALAMTARYVRQEGNCMPRRKSYHYNALAVWWIPWQTLVLEWLAANAEKRKGNLAPLRQFLQKRLAKFWREEESSPWGALQGAGYTKEEYVAGQTWEGERYRFLTVDMQRDHYWFAVRAWQVDGSSRLLAEGRAVTIEAVASLAEQYAIKPAAFVFIDAQHNTGVVYDACARYGWTALHGSGDAGFKHYNGRRRQPVTRFYSAVQTAVAPRGGAARYLFWSNEKVKDVLALLRTGKGAPWQVPDDVSDDYQKQLDSETKKEVVNPKTKSVAMRWVKIRADNHLWDCEAMQTAAAMMLGVLGGGET